jgi:RNA polymerase sigma-70 factor (ECF subfamily)
MEQLSYKEIAELMDITPKTVENQMTIALRFIRESLFGIPRGGLNQATLKRFLY